MTNDKIITIRIPGEVVQAIQDTTDSVSKFIRDAVDNSLKAAKSVRDSVNVTDSPRENTRQETQANTSQNSGQEYSQPVQIVPNPSPVSTIYAYQNAKTAMDQKCENCGKEIPANTDTVIGLATDGKPHFFCTDCKK